VEQARTRVILVGGDARRLRALRLFLDALGVFDAVAVATGAAGLNAIVRQPWAAAIVLDDLTDMAPDQLIAAARRGGVRAPILGLSVAGDRARVQALYAAGAAEVVPLGPAPTPEIARALARTIERQALLDRIEALEQELLRQRVTDDETGLHSTWRFIEDWRLEAFRTRRRGGDLSMLTVGLECEPPLDKLPERERITLLRQVGRLIRTNTREGDIGVHDGGGRFRVLLVDADSAAAADVATKLSIALRTGLQTSGLAAQASVHLADSSAPV
jgi:PleD family two-component response regulator